VNPYSVYDYLTFILPGGMLLFVSGYGWFGWPWHEPGATALVGLIAAAFVIGNALAACATWIEPVFLGRRPGSRPDGLWGQFGERDRYAGRRDEIAGVFKNRYKEDLPAAYRLAQTELRDLGKAIDLDRLNSQIGFYRGMAVASAVSFAIEVAYVVFWHSHLPTALWLGVFAILTCLFTYRFQRFWKWFGDYVIRAVMILERPPSNRPNGNDATDNLH
jgi:hypothetical protein